MPVQHIAEMDGKLERKPSFKLPEANNAARWKEIEKEISQAVAAVLPKRAMSRLPIDTLVSKYEEVVYNQLLKVCGIRESSVKDHPHRSRMHRPSRRERLIRQEKNTLRSRHKAMKKGVNW